MYDIFISYRRVGGAQYARILQLMLIQRGYKVFLDYDELTDGVFSDKIRAAIKDAPVFMLVLSEGSMQRCADEGDWVREEITLAVHQKKHIVPINPDNGFDGFPEGMPAELKESIGSHQHSEISFGQALGATIDLMIKNRLVPTLGERSTNEHKDEDYVAARESLRKMDTYNRFMKRLGIVSAVAVIAIVLGSLFMLSRNHEPEEKGEPTIEKEELTFEKAYSEQLLRTANENNQLAQYYLGLVMENGYGITANASQAVEWYRKAAEQGLDSAQVNLAICYLNGIGVTKNKKEAKRWLQKAAEKGNSDAMYNLGGIFHTEGNKSEAIKWLKKAQENGSEEAKEFLQQL